MKIEERNKLFKRAIEKWGERSQLEMAQEEATELALACRKFIRKQDDKNFQNLCEEIADVEIMIAQIRLMFPAIQFGVDDFKNQKLERLKKRLDEGRYEGK